MNEGSYKTARNLAGLSEFVGLIFCVLGVVSGFNSVLNSGELEGTLVLHILTTGCFPTVAGGLLLIVAGRILRVVIDNSGA
ncbi:MAG: hypothetical protein CMJ95_02300 [Planctomycetes bacterium]|nr:hypothetical protein [Planctomycetota bacterium]